MHLIRTPGRGVFVQKKQLGEEGTQCMSTSKEASVARTQKEKDW